MAQISVAFLNVGSSWQRCVKRLLDIAVSVMLLLLLTPLFLLIALFVSVSSPGGPFFRTVRIGRKGRRFHILKFRTMRAHDGAVLAGVTSANDPRITRVGGLLRKTKLDELPQLLNVLAGQMSLVGPRPEDERFVENYTLTQKMLLAVRPGITGPATVKFRSEEELLAQSTDPSRMYIEQVLPAKCAIDMDYLLNWSLRSDARVLIGTAVAIVRPPTLPAFGPIDDHSAGRSPHGVAESPQASRMHVA